jgi:hypothetical protein
MSTDKDWGDDFEGTTATFSIDSMVDGDLTAKMVLGGTKHDRFNGNDSQPAGPTMNVKFEIVTPPAPRGETGDPELAGKTFSFKYWLNRPEARQIMLDELKRLGFQVDEWGDAGSAYPKKVMVPAAFKYLRLEQVELKVTKKTKAGNSRKFTSIYLNGRVGSTDPIPSADVLACKDKPETMEEAF